MSLTVLPCVSAKVFFYDLLNDPCYITIYPESFCDISFGPKTVDGRHICRRPYVVTPPTILSSTRAQREQQRNNKQRPGRRAIQQNQRVAEEHLDLSRATMASLPPALDFSATEEEICARWEKEGTFKAQDRLSRERGDEVRHSRELRPFATATGGTALLTLASFLLEIERPSRSMMGLLLPQACLITVIFWLELSRIPSPDTHA